jgi:hypothetical protein
VLELAVTDSGQMLLLKDVFLAPMVVLLAKTQNHASPVLKD